MKDNEKFNELNSEYFETYKDYINKNNDEFIGHTAMHFFIKGVEFGRSKNRRFLLSGGQPKFRLVPKVVKWGTNISIFWLGKEFVYIGGEII